MAGRIFSNGATKLIPDNQHGGGHPEQHFGRVSDPLGINGPPPPPPHHNGPQKRRPSEESGGGQGQPGAAGPPPAKRFIVAGPWDLGCNSIALKKGPKISVPFSVPFSGALFVLLNQD